MAYIEKQRHANHTYYYLVKSVRLSSTTVRKVRIFLGRRVPSRDRLQEILLALEKKSPRAYSPRWLTGEVVEKLDDLRASIAVFRSIPGDILPKDFLVRFTYHTNAIEGNPLSLRQTALVLVDGIAPEGTRTEHVIEALNSRDAWDYLQSYRGRVNRGFVCGVQRQVTKYTGCRVQGSYRDGDVRIAGSQWVPPPAADVEEEMETLFRDFDADRSTLHPVELASVLHNRIVRTHPFTGGNGRTARLLMNWVLMRKKFPPVIIEVRNKGAYYSAIEKGDVGEDSIFAGFVAKQLLAQYTTPRVNLPKGEPSTPQ